MTTKNDLAEMYQRTAEVYRNSAVEWRKLAEDMPPGLAGFALQNAEYDDQCAEADETRANEIMGKNNSTICLHN